jgi:NAD-dependent SIR2 family protein deacetylase
MRRAEPNDGHRALAMLERSGVVVHVITQNVDRLHRKGGSHKVTELHGALAEVGCLACGAVEDRDALQERILVLNPGWTSRDAPTAPDGDADLPAERVERFVVPPCTRCGGVLKPRVVFFGDNVPRAVVDEAFGATDAAEVLLVVGSSLAVYSGYRFLRRAVERGTPVVIVNRGPVRGEEHAALKIDAGTGATLDGLVRGLAILGGIALRAH